MDNKYRRQIIYGKIKTDIGKILRQLCEYKGVEIPPELGVSSFMGYLKEKSSLMIFDRHANLKYEYGNRHFWCKGYHISAVGRNKKVIEEYIKKQLQEDIACD